MATVRKREEMEGDRRGSKCGCSLVSSGTSRGRGKVLPKSSRTECGQLRVSQPGEIESMNPGRVKESHFKTLWTPRKA